MSKRIYIIQCAKLWLVLLFILSISCKLYSQNYSLDKNPWLINYPSWNTLTDDQKKLFADSVTRINAIKFLSNYLGDKFYNKNLSCFGVYSNCVLFEIKYNKCNSGKRLIDVIVPKWWANDSCKITVTKKQIVNCLKKCDSCNFMIDFAKAFEIAKSSEIQIDKHKYDYSFGFYGGNPKWVFETKDNPQNGENITIDANNGTYQIGGWVREY
jgi:hypothetical protein